MSDSLAFACALPKISLPSKMASFGRALAGPWRLQYFPMPGAPGEVVRLLLTLSGTEWKDERVPGKEWGALKPTTAFGCMPILTHETDGRSLAQSRALARFIAKSAKLGGSGPLYPEDDYLAFRVDEMVDALEDVRLVIIPTFGIADQAEKEAARAALFATDGGGKIFEGFKRIEGLIGADGHMVAGQFTLADCWLFATVNAFRAGFLDGVPTTGWLEELPKLKSVIETVAAAPEVKAYYTAQAETNKTYSVFVAS